MVTEFQHIFYQEMPFSCSEVYNFVEELDKLVLGYYSFERRFFEQI